MSNRIVLQAVNIHPFPVAELEALNNTNKSLYFV